jgi:hypothetical protein
MYQRWLGPCLLAAMSMSAAGARELDRAGLLHRVAGNTIHFAGDGEDTFEFLAPGGEIRGESSVHGEFRARWRLLDDHTMCFESDDPMASGCVGVELDGSKITFARRDGVIEGPFELLRGNPRKL